MLSLLLMLLLLLLMLLLLIVISVFLQLMFTPQHVKDYSTMMIMTLQETGSDVFSLPISAKSVVPPISLLTPLLKYGRCFLEYPYTRDVELLNESDLPVKYMVPDQQDQTELIYSTPHPSGVIEPHSTLKLPLEIKLQTQGEVNMALPISILHSTEPVLSVELSCIGEGPVVYVNPTSLQWDVCPVLTPISMVVTLSNQSLIPAEFRCALVSYYGNSTMVPSSPLSLYSCTLVHRLKGEVYFL